MIFSLLFYGFLLYLLYRLVFHFIIPIYKTTKQVKKSFRQMQEQMHQQSNEQYSQAQASKTKPDHDTKAGEYIDFEEIK